MSFWPYFVQNMDCMKILLHFAALAVALHLTCPVRGEDFSSARITVDTTEVFQRIDNFGASDCWSFQFVGENWPEETKNRIADLLFSKKSDADGNPEGIGLSLWRFNIGSGSRDNPDNVIPDVWRTTECFCDSTGRFDFAGKQNGQIWFMKEARKRGCEYLLGFCNSAPWFMTRNRQSCNIGGNADEYNVDSTGYSVFAGFLADVWKGLKKNHGIELDYVSPFNEPEWDWKSPGQEGSPASVGNISSFVRILGEKFRTEGIPARIIFPESGAYGYLYDEDSTRTWIDRQVYSFFDEESPYYIGDVYGVERLMAAHSYWTTEEAKLVPVRRRVGEEISKYDVRLWQSEVCIMSNDSEIGGGGGRDLGMKTAMYVAKIIHHDLVTAGVSSWQWWTAVSTEDYKDGLLFVDKNIEGTDNLYVSKLLWALGNYSRFVRPGAVRTGADSDCPDVLVSSFMNQNGSHVIVIQNQSGERKDVSISGSLPGPYSGYLTSAGAEDGLRYVGNVSADSFSLPAKSIITLVEPD